MKNGSKKKETETMTKDNTSKMPKCDHQLIGSLVRVFDKKDESMFEPYSARLMSINATYIIVIIDDGEPEGSYITVVPLSEISQIDTILETVKEEEQ